VLFESSGNSVPHYTRNAYICTTSASLRTSCYFRSTSGLANWAKPYHLGVHWSGWCRTSCTLVFHTVAACAGDGWIALHLLWATTGLPPGCHQATARPASLSSWEFRRSTARLGRCGSEISSGMLVFHMVAACGGDRWCFSCYTPAPGCCRTTAGLPPAYRRATAGLTGLSKTLCVKVIKYCTHAHTHTHTHWERWTTKTVGKWTQHNTTTSPDLNNPQTLQRTVNILHA